MVNPVEIAPLTLQGRGFAQRHVGEYQPGEFKRLVNLEVLEDGSLRKRPGVEMGPSARKGNEGEFIGHLGEWMAFYDAASANNDAITYYKRYSTFDNTNNVFVGMNLYGAGFDPTSDSHRIVGFFRYNLINYWLSVSTDNAGTVSKNRYWIHRHSNAAIAAVTLPLVFAATLPDVHTQLFEVSYDSGGFAGVPAFEHIKFFIHRDRLWIITNRGVYFSKATDPTVFAAPSGGFFKFPDDLVKDAVAIQDSIYVMGNDNLNYITYTSDPNTDARQTLIALGIGGDALAVYEDSVYCLRQDQLYLVENTRVTKVFDLKLGIPYNSGNSIQVTTYFDYLIICFRAYGAIGDTDKAPYLGTAGAVTGGYSVFSTGVFWLNMKTGSVFEFLYNDDVDTLNPAPGSFENSVGHPVSFYANPFEDEESQQYYLFFQTVKPSLGDGHIFSMKLTLDDTEVTDLALDFAWKPVNVAWWTSIPVLAEVESFSPDGSEMWMKKFRSLVLEGEFPPQIVANNLKVSFAYDQQAYGAELDLYAPVGFNDDINTRLPVPVRLPLNQRSRSLSLKLQQDRYYNAATAKPTASNRLELRRATLLWTPTSRAPVGRSGS